MLARNRIWICVSLGVVALVLGVLNMVLRGTSASIIALSVPFFLAAVVLLWVLPNRYRNNGN
jgi:hypothetical protein